MKSHKNQKNQKKLGFKPTNVGKELIKRTKDLNRNIENIMGKSAKTDSLPISDGLVMYLHGAGDSGERYVRVDFNDYSTYKDFYMIMDRTKLREVAYFINQYLEE